MKKIKIIIFFSFFFLLWGCNKSDSSSNNSLTGVGIGDTSGGTTGTVTIQVQGQQEQYQGATVFMIYINPSVDINLASVSDGTNSLQIGDQFSAGQFTQCYYYDSIQSGTQISIQFTGTTVKDNKNFDVTTNYTIP